MLRYRYAESGRCDYAVGIYMDVTRQVRDHREVAARGARLMDIQSELAHTSRLSAMGEMAAALAHELNQPLTAVGNSAGAIEMMLADLEKPVDETLRQRVLRAARHAESQAVRAGEIVRRLREFISRGEADSRAEDLGELIDDAIALALPSPAAVGVSINKLIDVRARTVLADRIQIQQVIVNLIRNAVEAMRDQPGRKVLNIAATASDGMATIRVADTGCGISPEVARTLFTPFNSTKSGGMGFGLSISRRIIETHGGRMWHEEGVLHGAEFGFTLPLVARG
jgi:two-component system sensor kinase FixL